MEQDGGTTDNTVVEHDFITLAQPRPGAARRLNEYIETPLRPQLPQPPPAKARPKKDPGRPVTSQPVAEPAKAPPPDPAGHGDSIICRQCNLCRCEACQGPRALPARWVCHDKCLCSAASVVDYCSCMCCVRGLFYHWAKDYEMDSDVSCADQPCSCAPHKRVLRWGCLGLLSLPLPCLCCYWPLRGCLRAAEAAYSKCTGRGCRCAGPPPHRTEQTPEKRLLDSNNSDC